MDRMGSDAEDLMSLMITEMALQSHEFTYHNGQIILDKGDPIDHIIFVLQGAVNVEIVHKSKKQVLVEKLRANCNFGYHSVMN